MQQVSGELWESAVDNAENQQEEAFDGLFDEAVEEHLKSECRDCRDGLCSRCQQWIASCIENWQDRQFDDQVEAEYDRLEQQEQQEEDALSTCHSRDRRLSITIQS